MATAVVKAESLARCVDVLVNGIEDRIKKIDRAAAEIAVQLREIDERRALVRTLLEEIGDER